MAENYKILYLQMRTLLDQYQNEIVPNLRKELDKREEVVRCKDCKHWEDGYIGYCTKNHTAMYYDGFCSNGERRKQWKD